VRESLGRRCARARWAGSKGKSLLGTQKPPERIGRYQIESELGRGMMGVVYEARDTSLGRPIALKMIRTVLDVSAKERESFERRFLVEARIVARLSHPGIVVVHDVGRDPETGQLFMALEYLVGTTLASMIAEGRAPGWRESLGILARVADALHYAHAQGVVHRDIKPANVMVLDTGQPKIMDFGIAKLETHEMTSTGEFMGTPLYMAPEQVLGEPVDGRTDLFSLGSIAYTLLAGRRAFEADNVPRILARVAYQDPPPPSRLAKGLPRDVDYLVARAMAKSPADRYATGKDMAEDIEDGLEARKPRHRAGWTAPAPAGEGTLITPRDAVAMPELELEPLDEEEPAPPAPPAVAASPPGRRPSRRSHPVAVLTLGMFFAGLLGYASVQWPERFDAALRVAGRLGRSAVDAAAEVAVRAVARPSPPAEVAGASAPPPAEAAAEGAPAAPGPGPSWAAGAPTPNPFAPPPVLVPSFPPSAVPATEGEDGADASETGSDAQDGEAPADDGEVGAGLPSQPAAGPGVTAGGAPIEPPGRLRVELEHSLEQGVFRVFVDGERLINERVEAPVTRNLLVFKLRRGTVQRILGVAPGRHRVRVQVLWKDGARSREVAATFRSGATRRLEAKLRGDDLELRWR
jgi:eukaryotic-like serine/threonine-protein kinase